VTAVTVPCDRRYTLSRAAYSKRVGHQRRTLWTVATKSPAASPRIVQVRGAAAVRTTVQGAPTERCSNNIQFVGKSLAIVGLGKQTAYQKGYRRKLQGIFLAPGFLIRFLRASIGAVERLAIQRKAIHRNLRYLLVRKGIYSDATEGWNSAIETCGGDKSERLGSFPAFERCHRLTSTGQSLSLYSGHRCVSSTARTLLTLPDRGGLQSATFHTLRTYLSPPHKLLQGWLRSFPDSGPPPAIFQEALDWLKLQRTTDN
jgi:hypothetical protein